MHESEAQRRALAERMDAIINNKPVLNKEDKSLLSVVAKLLEQNDVGAALRMILDAKGANVSLGAVAAYSGVYRSAHYRINEGQYTCCIELVNRA